MLVVLLAGNALSHAELLFSLHSGQGVRVGVAAILMLIMLIGGRIIPSFTRNWLVRQSPDACRDHLIASTCWRSFSGEGHSFCGW